MQRALSAGYMIDFVYICLDSPTTNIGRVAKRVLAGGHHVPDRDVQRRYHRSLQNHPTALAHAERARVFDNSEPGEPKPLLETRERRIVLLREALPDWFRVAFGAESPGANATQHIERFLQELLRERR